MMTTETSAIQRNAIESQRLAAAMAEFERRGGQVRQVGTFKPEPAPPRKNWIDPDTVLVRRRRTLTPSERDAIRRMAVSL